MDFHARDQAIAYFRRQVATAARVVPLRHQAEWQLASEGWTLLDRLPKPGEHYQELILPASMLKSGSRTVRALTINGIPSYIVQRAIAPRVVSGYRGPAHVIADLGAYKVGKSFWTALWTSGFAIIPDAKVHIIGAEYSTAEPEFTYLADFLLSERGMNMRADVYHNDKRAGRMRIRLRNGMEFEVKSWERKEGLKGKKLIAYVYCEAYQLPGLEVYTTLAQNLRELRGYALASTTPDRPWVSVFHDYGHGLDPDWHCTCAARAEENPFTFDQRARDRDDPTKNGIMTRERFAIAWEGRLGSFIGRVYDFTRGDPSRYFSPVTHPHLWKGGSDGSAHS